LKYALILLVSLVWYPHSLMRVQRLGYDFTIFYGGAGYIVPGEHHVAYMYSPWTSMLFEPLRMFPYETAFAIHYIASAFAFCVLVRSASRRSEILGMAVCLLGLYPYMLSQELGSITVVFAALCLTFPGAILAACFKPYLCSLAVYHALHRFRRDRAASTRHLDSLDLQEQSAVPHSTTVKGG
jgi:hypothetical protein